MLHIKFQASVPCSSEEEDFLIFFDVFLWFEPEPPGPAPSGTFIWTNLVKNHQAMLQAKFEASEPSASEAEDF